MKREEEGYFLRLLVSAQSFNSCLPLTSPSPNRNSSSFLTSKGEITMDEGGTIRGEGRAS